MMDIQKELENSRSELADLKTGYQSVLDFIDKMEHLGQFQDRLDITSDIERIWTVLSKEIKQFAAAEACALFMVDDETQDFELRSSSPVETEGTCRKEIGLQIECGTFSWIINRRQPSIIPSLAFKENRTIIMLPLSTVRKTVGCVMLLTPIKDSAITHETLKLLSMLAKQCSLVMENSQLYDSLRKEHESLRHAQAQVLQAEKLASIGRLTSGAFHEILNPLNIISGYLQLIQMKSKSNADISGHLITMKEQTDRVSSIVNDLLKFSQFSMKNVTTLKVSELIDTALVRVAETHNGPNIRIIRNYDPDLPEVNGDAESLTQVFFNLLANAWEAMAGKGVMTIHTRRLEEMSTVENKREGIEVVFEDDGCGVPEKDIGRILDPFFTTKETDKGTGLGLSLSYGIIKEHGGEIRIESVLDSGTTLTVSLPVDAV